MKNKRVLRYLKPVLRFCMTAGALGGAVWMATGFYQQLEAIVEQLQILHQAVVEQLQILHQAVVALEEQLGRLQP